jgi:hypothetical protein
MEPVQRKEDLTKQLKTPIFQLFTIIPENQILVLISHQWISCKYLRAVAFLFSNLTSLIWEVLSTKPMKN